jgi:hypothetical protein
VDRALHNDEMQLTKRTTSDRRVSQLISVFYRHDEQRRMPSGLGMVNIRAGASWRGPRAAPRPVRGAGKWVSWPESVRSASAKEGASRPLHASGVERYSWETRRPFGSVGPSRPAGDRDYLHGARVVPQ